MEGPLSNLTPSGGEVCYAQGNSSDAVPSVWWETEEGFTFGWTWVSPLSTQFPSIFGAVSSKSCRMKDCFDGNGWNWRKLLSGVLPSSSCEERKIRSLKDTLSSTCCNNRRDEFRWRWTTLEVFTIKSMYTFLQHSGVADTRFDQLWSIKIPLKVKIFVRLVLRRRVLAVDILLKRGWISSANCVLCSDSEETADHLFVTCPFSRSLLECLLSNKRETSNCEAVDKLWEVSKFKQGAFRRWELFTIASMWWSIWLERNQKMI